MNTAAMIMNAFTAMPTEGGKPAATAAVNRQGSHGTSPDSESDNTRVTSSFEQQLFMLCMPAAPIQPMPVNTTTQPPGSALPNAAHAHALNPAFSDGPVHVAQPLPPLSITTFAEFDAQTFGTPHHSLPMDASGQPAIPQAESTTGSLNESALQNIQPSITPLASAPLPVASLNQPRALPTTPTAPQIVDKSELMPDAVLRMFQQNISLQPQMETPVTGVAQGLGMSLPAAGTAQPMAASHQAIPLFVIPAVMPNKTTPANGQTINQGHALAATPASNPISAINPMIAVTAPSDIPPQNSPTNAFEPRTEGLLAKAGERELDLPALTPAHATTPLVPQPVAPVPTQPQPLEQQMDTNRLLEQFDELALRTLRSDSKSLRIELKPAAMGRIIMECRETKSGFSIEIDVQHSSIRDILNSHEQQLRASLQNKGIQLGQFSVSCHDRQDGSSGQAFDQQQGFATHSGLHHAPVSTPSPTTPTTTHHYRKQMTRWVA